MSSDTRPQQLHRLSAVDPVARRGVCSVCGPTWVKRRERRGRVSWSCGTLHQSYSAPKALISRVAAAHGLRDDRCWKCGFEAIDKAQLDVHHVNEDHDDNRPENLMLLCANCHRLIHALGGRWQPDESFIHWLTSRGLSYEAEQYQRAEQPA